MAMVMMGMMGVSGAQTIDQNWVRQNADNPRDARGAIRYANSIANTNAKYPAPKGMDERYPQGYYQALAEAGQSVGAPHVDMVTNHDIPRSKQSCWEAAAWSRVDNHPEKLDSAIWSAMEKHGVTLNVLPHTAGGTYVGAVCAGY